VSQPQPLILVADDQADVVEALRLLLKAEGYRTVIAHVPEGVLALLEQEQVDAALIDLNYTRDTTSGREGMDLLSRTRALDPTLPVIVMTAWGSVDKAVEAMRLGARDFIEKPWDNARLLTTLRSQIELGRALRVSQRLEQENQLLRRSGLPDLIAESPAMRPVLELMERVAPSDANVLVTGEHGTGKEVVARWIHAASGRRDHTLVVVNVGGLSEGVFESELFGHVRGAFTDAKSDKLGLLAQADKGTLFLDEIGDMPLGLQPKLLRVLEERKVRPVGGGKEVAFDVRLISATNRDLEDAIQQGQFREDLYFRLNVIQISLPPLRARGSDVLLIAQSFVDHFAKQAGKAVLGLSPEAAERLSSYAWPGNVRELRNAIERAVALTQHERITVDDLPERIRAYKVSHVLVASQDPEELVNLAEVEKRYIARVLGAVGGNKSTAAKILGIDRTTLYKKLAQYKIN
jgi:DNA-binding NtrC family response regulator